MPDRIANEEPPAPAQETLPAASVRPTVAASARPSVDDMSEWSFPASDPPATWTWDVERQVRD